jgi:hypothetical protein
MAKMGRPGEERARRGRLRGAVRPDIKREAEALAKADTRLRSLSHLMEVALSYFMRDYKRAGSNIDMQGFPIVPCDQSQSKVDERRRVGSHP